MVLLPLIVSRSFPLGRAFSFSFHKKPVLTDSREVMISHVGLVNLRLQPVGLLQALLEHHLQLVHASVGGFEGVRVEAVPSLTVQLKKGEELSGLGQHGLSFSHWNFLEIAHGGEPLSPFGFHVGRRGLSQPGGVHRVIF